MANFENLNPIAIQQYLKGISFPLKKEDLLKAAQNNDAQQEIFDVLNKLPDKKYLSPAEVSEELGKIL